jgi:uncharacterized protein YaiE (UPF0345 family)
MTASLTDLRSAITLFDDRKITFTTNATERMRIDSSGNLGIGTSSPAKQLDLAASNTGITTGDPLNTLRFTDTDTTSAAGQPMGRIEWYSADADTAGVKAYIQAQATDGSPDADMIFATNHVSGGGTAERMRIQYDGNVGIGTSSPTSLLTLGLGTFTAAAASTSAIYTDASAGQIYLADGYSWNSRGGTERMRITSTGNVGIGTSSPALAGSDAGRVIQVEDATRAAFRATRTSGGGDVELRAFASSGASLTNNANGQLTFGTNATERMRIDASGNLGLGVTPSAWTSGYKVLQASDRGAHFAANTSSYSTAPYLFIGNNGYGNSGAGFAYITSNFSAQYRQVNAEHQWLTAPSGTAGNTITFTQAMTLDASGYLLVGATSSNGVGANRFQVGQSGGQAQLLAKTSTGHASIYATGTDVYQTWVSGGFLAFGEAPSNGSTFTERARITSSGNLLVGLTSATGVAKLQVSGPIRTTGYTVATLPAGTVGMRTYVTDALAPSFGVAVAGSGAVTIPVFYDGANWIVA